MKPVGIFPLERYSAFIFDCDGTIADSMPVHLTAWNEALAPWRTQISHAEHSRWAGRTTARIVELLNERDRLTIPVAAAVQAKEEAYHKLIPGLKAVRAVRETIEAYRGRLPFAVVSGSPRASVNKTLTQLGLLSEFKVILGAEDYARGKPAPEGFLSAAAQLGVSPARCLVFEDGELGIEAARAAGMKWVRVVPEGPGFDLENSDL